ncbi:TonB-dependent receptor [Caulobacter sp.]|uniref:TonB-dependent receptor n=1 Tax=Caulobacter sp. TaxID=78 RepID=UPI003BAE38AC
MARNTAKLAAVAALWAGPLAAQTLPAAAPPRGADSAVLDEIIVTAQKREERLLDVPQSVSVLSAQTLAQVHAERFSDYFTRIPSAAIVETQAGQARLLLRGINTGGVGATVATYVDETPYGSATALANGAVLAPDIDPSDLERVEVLRGPQGTLYGANSLGGLVKYVTAAPSTTATLFSAEVGVEDVSHGTTGWSVRAAGNLPLSDTFAVRVSGSYREDPGYIDDPRLGRDVNDGETYGGRASILWRPITDLTVRASAVAQNIRSNGPNGVDVDPVTLEPVSGALVQNRTVREPNAIDYRIYNLTAEYDFGAVALTSATSASTLDQVQVQDATGVYGELLTDAFGAPLGAPLDQVMNQKRFTQELRLASSGVRSLEWTLGAYYTRERNRLDQTLFGVDADTAAPVDDLSELFLVGLGSHYDEYAGFANGTLHLSPRFDVSLGGRYSHNRQRAVQTTSGLLAGDDLALDANSSDNVFTYSIAPAFKPNRDTTIYARIARGYRPGGPNILPPAAPTAVPRQFGADTTTNYELGVKSELLDRKLSIELTGFLIDWKNVQLLADVGGFAVNTNGGSARSKGVELALIARPTRGLTLGANGAYVDAELTEDAPELIGGVAGDWLPYAPRTATTFSADYERPLTAKVTGRAGVSWRHTGKRRSDFDTTYGQRRLEAFDVVDAYAGVSIERFRIEAFARNLTDSDGIVALGGPGTAPDGAASAAVVRPRSFGVTLGVRY